MAFFPELVMWICAVFTFPFLKPKFFARKTISAAKPNNVSTNTDNVTSYPFVWQHFPETPSPHIDPAASVHQHDKYALMVITPKPDDNSNAEHDLLKLALLFSIFALSIISMYTAYKQRSHSRSRARQRDASGLSTHQAQDSLLAPFLQAQLNEAQSLLQDYKALLREEREISNKQSAGMRDLQNQNSTLQQKIEFLKEKNLTANDHYAQQQRTIDELRAAAIFAQAEAQHDEKDTETLRCRLQASQSQLDTADNKISNQDGQIRVMAGRCKALEEAVKVKDAELQAKDDEIKAKEDSKVLYFEKNVKLQDEKDQVAKKLNELNVEYNDLNELYTELDKDYRELDQANTDVLEKNKQLEIQLLRLEDEHKRAVQERLHVIGAQQAIFTSPFPSSTPQSAPQALPTNQSTPMAFGGSVVSGGIAQSNLAHGHVPRAHEEDPDAVAERASDEQLARRKIRPARLNKPKAP